MQEYTFAATGTIWTLLVDSDEVPDSHFSHIKEYALSFERTYSRFLETSLIGEINSKQSEQVNEEFAQMLAFGFKLKQISEGYFDINVGSILEGYGYDNEYSFKLNEDKRLRSRGIWEIKDLMLSCEGLVHLDLGAYGKGFLIGLIAQELRRLGYLFFLVDGGRDFYGSSKSGGEGWRIALEHPQDPLLAIGEYVLKDYALACSGVLHRRRNDFHHLINPMEHRPVKDIVEVFVAHNDPMIADGVSTALFVSPKSVRENIVREFKPGYCIVYSDGTFEKSEEFRLFF